MTIRIKPETEQLVKEELQSGHFRSVDEIIVHGVQAKREKLRAEQSVVKGPKRPRPEGKKSLAQLFAESPFKGLEIDFERDPDHGRDIEL